ncbi:MAG: hypothetical protein HPY59_03600 [Anaerolineae bacterium]|nr:hypothetical protein [Anaerolineae bacterium]
MNPDSYDPMLESLKYQLEILKTELESIDKTVARIDEITQTIKNWAIVTWAGVISLAVGQPELRKYIMITALLPLIFWYMDGYWRHLQRRSTFRAIKIREFLNDERLQKSFAQKKLVGFLIYDPIGHQYKDLPEYKKYIAARRTLNFAEVRNFYLGLIIISVILGVVFFYI